MNRYEEVKQIKENYRAALPSPKEEWPPKVQRALAFIMAHLYDPRLTVSWMKEQCGINGKSFASRFCKHLYKYPKEHILHHRTEAGKRLLEQTEATVTQIALDVGFNSLSAFCKTFKSREGVRPSRWRAGKR